MPELKLYNTLTRKKEVFQPEDPDNVRMYVCGPTVYDYAHIGNARPVIVFDVLYRLLRHLYGEEHVTYVRNITDVDDKINARALRDYPDLPLNEAIRNVTEKTANQFHDDVRALGCLEPTHEPRATEHIEGMASMIQTLLDKGNAYVAEGEQGREVLFRVSSMAEYGQLSNRKLEDQQAGARVAVEAHKENPGDFVLWKESREHEPGWQGTFNGEQIHGRPGWHIECSVMSKFHLGETFDIHGGGLDLIFPHHENEIAQSRCAHGSDCMANYWMHNGYLQVEGKKMSKSEGNFVTIREVLEGTFTEPQRNEKRPPRNGHAARLLMLSTHYRSPIDWTEERIDAATEKLASWSLAISAAKNKNFKFDFKAMPPEKFLKALCDDLNTSLAISLIDSYAAKSKTETIYAQFLLTCVQFMGLMNLDLLSAYQLGVSSSGPVDSQTLFENHERGMALKVAVLNGDMKLKEAVLSEFAAQGLEVELSARGEVAISVREDAQGSSDEKLPSIDEIVTQRLKALNDKNFAEADRIRDELASQGIQLKDSKDSETGERVTTWEVKR
jgi:cysteinyl-tRNA synthetase